MAAPAALIVSGVVTEVVCGNGSGDSGIPAVYGHVCPRVCVFDPDGDGGVCCHCVAAAVAVVAAVAWSPVVGCCGCAVVAVLFAVSGDSPVTAVLPDQLGRGISARAPQISPTCGY